MAPQLFVGVSLGAGLSKVLEENKEPPTFFKINFNTRYILANIWNNNI